MLIALVVVSLPSSPLFQPFGYDREIFRYVGLMIRKGYVPYRDFFDHKPPGIYFMAAIADVFGYWGFWILSLVSAYITSFVIFIHARKSFTSFSSILVLPLIFIFLSRHDNIYEGGGMSREYTQMFITLFIFLRPSNQLFRFFILGVLYAAVFFTQQNEIIAATPVGAYFILWDNEQKKLKSFRDILRHGLSFIAGLIFLSALICSYLYYNNAFNEFIEQAFKFNTGFYVQKPYYDSFSETWMIYYYVFPNFTLFAILYIFFARKNKNFVEYSVFFLALFIQLMSSSLGHHFGHYYLSFIPYLCYAAFIAISGFEPHLDKRYHHMIATAVFFLYIFPMPLILRFKALSEHKYWSYKAQRGFCYDTIKNIKGQDGQLFVMGDASYLAFNTDLDCVSKCKLNYFHFYSNSRFDSENKMYYDVIETLKKNHCKYIIDFSQYKPIGREELQQHWTTFVNTNYHMVQENTGHFRVLQINDQAAAQ